MKKTKTPAALAVLVLITLLLMVPVPVRATEPGKAAEATLQANGAILRQLPFHDQQDFADADKGWIAPLENAVLNHSAGKQAQGADCSVRLTRALFNDILTGQTSFPARVLLGQITYEGNLLKLNELWSLLDAFDPWFNIVTP
jgi:alkyl sulfatase BDS1-like metallo-beta-lactamase superfamily hydrolase